MVQKWIDSPIAWPVDSPVHAGITRSSLQNNLQCAYDNSGYYFDAVPTESIWVGGTIYDEWIWYEEWQPLPIPVFRKQGGGWRDYEIEIEAKFMGHTGDVRIFLLDTQARPLLNSATGMVGGTSAYKSYAITAAMSRHANTISLDRIGTESLAGYILPVVWVHIAAKSPVALGCTLYMRGLAFAEQT